LLDYEDHLRQRGFRQWTKDDREAREVRAVGRRSENRSDPTDRTDPSDRAVYARWFDHADSAVVANAIICLIHQTNYLLDQQIRGLERDFIQQGGYSEQLAAARVQHRQRELDRSDRTDQSDSPAAPACRLCGKPLVLRTARQGSNAGSQFWGCSSYPQCKGTQPLA